MPWRTVQRRSSNVWLTSSSPSSPLWPPPLALTPPESCSNIPANHVFKSEAPPCQMTRRGFFVFIQTSLHFIQAGGIALFSSRKGGTFAADIKTKVLFRVLSTWFRILAHTRTLIESPSVRKERGQWRGMWVVITFIRCRFDHFCTYLSNAALLFYVYQHFLSRIL